MKNRCLIVTGGTLREEFLTDFLREHVFEKVICVDGALALAEKLDLSFDYLVGDFDSVDKKVLDGFLERRKKEQPSVEIRQFQAEKDDTDTDIAINLALSKGADEITLLGATGTRIDHLLGNLHILLKPLKAGVPAFIYDEYNKIYFIEKETRFCKKELYGPYISFIPFGGDVLGVTQTGFKYETHEIDFCMGESLGISNELVAEEGNIPFKQGRFIVIEARDTRV